MAHFSVRLLSWTIEFIEQLTFYPKLKKFIRCLNDPDTMFDVGSNKGQFINFFISIHPKVQVHAFEPEEKHLEVLKTVGNGNIIINNIGVSNSNDRKTFYRNILDETSTFSIVQKNSKWLFLKSILLLKKPENLARPILKQVITLDNYCQQNNIKKIDYLKIDVEGHEYEVIQGSISLLKGQKILYVQIEQHNDDLYLNNSKKIEELLNLNGYYEIQRIKHSFGNFYDIIYAIQK